MAVLGDLVVPTTVEQWDEKFLALAKLADFPVESWAPGSVPLVIINMLATALADVSFAVAAIANGQFLETSQAGYLKALAKSHYAEEKPLATFTEGKLVLTNPTATPQNVLANVHLFADNTGKQYRSLTTGTVNAFDTLDIDVQAVGVGSAYNVANLAITVIVTSLPGLTVSNPAIGTDGTWITSRGVDVISDAAFREICRLKWATLATGSPKAAYLYWAKTTAGVGRATVDDMNPGGANTVWVYIDNALSIATLQVTLDAKVPAGTRATAKLATATNVTIPGVIDVKAANRAEVETAVSEALVDLANSTDIGGIVYDSEITHRIKAIPGVVDANISSSFGNTTENNYQLGSTNYPQFTLALTYVEQA